MWRRVLLGLLLLIGPWNLVACQPAQLTVTPGSSTGADASPTPEPAPRATAGPTATITPEPVPSTGLRALLKFVSPYWAQTGSGSVLGTGLCYLDVAQIRADLNIPPITGEDNSKAKAGLILGLNTQGFGSPLGSTMPNSFQERGWDIADVDQALAFLDDFTTVLHGNFSRAAIRDRLREQDYQVETRGDYQVFTKAAQGTKEYPQYAVKDDILIYSSNQGVLESLVDRDRYGKPGLDQEASLQSLYDQLAGSWGAVLAPRGDLAGYKDWLTYLSYLRKDNPLYQSWVEERIDQEPTGVWDLWAIGWKNKSPTRLQFVYHYPTQQDAADEVDLVEQALKESPSLSYNQLWGDVLKPSQIAQQGNLIVATATGTSEQLVSKLISSEEWGLLPMHFGTMPSLPQTTSGQTESTKSDAGWTLYAKEADGFSIELPSGWVSLDLNPQALEVSLASLKKKNPQLAQLLTTQARDAARSGMKLMAFGLPGSSDSQRMAIASVVKSTEPVFSSLETVAIQLRNQYRQMVGLLGDVTVERLRLPAGDTRKLRLQLHINAATGESFEMRMDQYLLINGDALYAINLYAVNDPDDKLGPTLQQILEQFRFIK